MNATEAIDQIEAWAKKLAPEYTIPRALRAMCIGARPKDVPYLLGDIVSASQLELAAATLTDTPDAHCQQPALCARRGLCASRLLRAHVLSALSIVLGCVHVAGPEFKGVPLLEDGNLTRWSEELAAANGVNIAFATPQSVRLDVSAGGDIVEAISNAIREAQIDAAKKPSVN